MEITVEQYQKKIDQENYQNFTESIKLTKRLAKTTITPALKKLCQQVQDAVDSGYLAQGELIITGLPFAIKFALQTGIINLPFQDSAKIVHFFDKEDTKSLQVYLVTMSEQINVSHLRIDEVASDPSALLSQRDVISEMVQSNLRQALDNYEQSQKNETKEETKSNDNSK